MIPAASRPLPAVVLLNAPNDSPSKARDSEPEVHVRVKLPWYIYQFL